MGAMGATGGTLYGVNNPNPLGLYTVDTSTGAQTLIAAITGTSGGAAFTGLSAAPAIASVPGPVVGAGLPGLLAGFGAMLAWYRKRRTLVA